LPPNLYLKRKTYYVWRDPRSGKTYGLGNDRGNAINQAIEANYKITEQETSRLVDRLTGNAERTVADWCDQWETNHPKARTKLLREALGHIVLARLEPLQIAEWLKRWDEKLRMRQAMLSTAKVVFRGAIGAGWIRTNPAADLTTTTPTVMRDRLTLESYKAVLANAEPPLAIAMQLAVVTGQRRADVIGLKRQQVKDGYLWVIQSKVKPGEIPAKIRFPLGLRIDALGLSLGNVIDSCRSGDIASPYIIHHTRHAGQAKPGHKYRDKTIEEMFRKAREASGITWTEGREPPTFHEIRSLSARLFEEQGGDTVALLGHKSERMNLMYRDARGTEWITVAA
jgi:integrase